MKGSSGNLAIPVVAGLALGIGLIVLFSINMKPSFSMSGDEIRAKVRDLPEVQAFYERYTPHEVIWREGNTFYAQYEMQRTWDFENAPEAENAEPGWMKELRLTVIITSFGRTSMELECGGPITITQFDHILEEIKTTNCLENP